MSCHFSVIYHPLVKWYVSFWVQPLLWVFISILWSPCTLHSININKETYTYWFYPESRSAVSPKFLWAISYSHKFEPHSAPQLRLVFIHWLPVWWEIVLTSYPLSYLFDDQSSKLVLTQKSSPLGIQSKTHFSLKYPARANQKHFAFSLLCLLLVKNIH